MTAKKEILNYLNIQIKAGDYKTPQIAFARVETLREVKSWVEQNL
jgi:hypothetical protein